MRLHTLPPRWLPGVAAIACAAALIPVAALAATASPAAAAPTARPARPVTAYVVNAGSISLGDTVSPIDTATNKAGKTIKAGRGPDAPE